MPLQAQFVSPTSQSLMERVAPYDYRDVTALIQDSSPLSQFYLHSYVSLPSSESFLLTLKRPITAPGNASLALSLNEDPAVAGVAVQVTGSPVRVEVVVTEIADLALVAPATLEAGLTLAVGLSAQACSAGSPPAPLCAPCAVPCCAMLYST